MNVIDLLLFKMTYLFANCDLDFSKEEQDTLEKFRESLTAEETSQADKALDELSDDIAKGFDAIRERTLEIATLLQPVVKDGDLTHLYYEVIDQMIQADGREHPNEKALLEEVRDLWG